MHIDFNKLKEYILTKKRSGKENNNFSQYFMPTKYHTANFSKFK